MNVLVAGASGFIGVNLCKKLVSLGHKVIGIDNFYSSESTNLEELYNDSSFTFIEHDIITPLVSSDILNNVSIDAICNLACPASPKHYLKDPVYTTKVSCFGVLNMLELAVERNVPILQASTSEIYGDPLEHPQNEEYWGNVHSIGPRACYDEGKRVAESLCFDFVRTKKAKVKVIRIFNTYGPHMHPNDGRVMSNFIVQAINKQALTVYGDGSQTRSFCFVDDLVRGIISFLELPCKDTAVPDVNVHGPINLGNPNEITISELVSEIEKFFPNSLVENKTLPVDDPQRRRPDITRAQKILAWNPEIQLKEGIQKTIEWFNI